MVPLLYAILQSYVIEIIAIMQYFLELMRVPRMESKVNCFLFKIQFNTQVCGYSLNTC